MSFTQILLVVPVIVLLFLRYFPRRRRRITDFSTAVSILQKSNFESRAHANRHLHNAFGIMNPFVNGEKEFHDEYITHVHRRLTKVTCNWSAIVNCAVNVGEKLSPIDDI